MKHYYINLEKRLDRKENMEQLFSQLEIPAQRIDAVDGSLVSYEKLLENNMDLCKSWLDPLQDRPLTPGEVGCILSHTIAWTQIVKTGEPGVILEDDIFLDKPSYNVRQIEERLDDFDLVYLIGSFISSCVSTHIILYSTEANITSS